MSETLTGVFKCFNVLHVELFFEVAFEIVVSRIKRNKIYIRQEKII